MRGAGAPRDEAEAEAALKASRDRVAAALAEADAAEKSARQRVLAAQEAELAAAAAQRTATAQRAAPSQRAAPAPRAAGPSSYVPLPPVPSLAPGTDEDEEDAEFQPVQWEQQPALCYAPPPPYYYPPPQALQHVYAQQGPAFSQTLFDMLSRTAAGSAHEATATAALRAAIEMGQQQQQQQQYAPPPRQPYAPYAPPRHYHHAQQQQGAAGGMRFPPQLVPPRLPVGHTHNDQDRRFNRPPPPQ